MPFLFCDQNLMYPVGRRHILVPIHLKSFFCSMLIVDCIPFTGLFFFLYGLRGVLKVFVLVIGLKRDWSFGVVGGMIDEIV